MTQHKALVVGHADADGHLIAEQVRRNLALIDTFDVKVVVDPARTKDHKAWTHLDAIKEIERSDFVFFVDLMFAPSSYAEEADAVTDFVCSHPDKRFFLVDHHPLPLRRLEADNLRVLYRPDVSECAFGPRSGMMVVAALCENQKEEVAEIKEPWHDVLARGMRRAAAHGGPLPGEKLLALLRANRWGDLLQLGNDAPHYHRLPRGLRPSSDPQSNTLKELDQTAETLLKHHRSRTERTGTAMSYDANIGQELLSYDAGQRTLQRNVPTSPKDLGALVTMLEVAALSLTTEPGKTFTLEQLIKEARNIGGLDFEERDVRIVLKKQNFLVKAGGEYVLK
jgi:hypothetical protein